MTVLSLPRLPPAEFAARRERVLEALGDGVMVLSSGTLVTWSNDIEHRFRPEADFFYLTGFSEPHAVLVLRPGAPAPFTLFVQPRDPEKETWTGDRLGPERAKEQIQADAAFSVLDLSARLPGLLDGAETLFFPLWKARSLDGQIQQALTVLGSKEHAGSRAPRRIAWPGEILHEMRLVKSRREIALLELAGGITSLGLRAGLARCHPGVTERLIQAAVEHIFVEAGAEGPGFPTIVAAGANACCLHYNQNNAVVKEKDLVLIDAGASLCGYSGDASRTVPASGKFTPEQLDLYQAVHEAQRQALKAIRPGGTLEQVHQAALEVLVTALVDWGILEGPVQDAIPRRDWRRFFPHRTSHWLGLDVHDPGKAQRGHSPRTLVPGMVFTVEPGLYLPLENESIPQPLRGQAVRIEDDVVMTEDGFRVITQELPVEPGELAQLTRDRK